MPLFVSIAFAAETAQEANNVPEAKIAIEGYCVVSLVEPATWIKGKAEIYADFEGFRYLFRGEEEKLAFGKDPKEYALAFGGNDLTELIDNDKRVPGKREYGLRYCAVTQQNSRTLLFATEENIKKFKSSMHYIEQIPIREEIEETIRVREANPLTAIPPN